MINPRSYNILNNNMGYVAGNLIFSEGEMKRRHDLVRQALVKVGADVLIAQLCFPSACMALDPEITWLLGTPGYKSTETVILPADGELVLIHGSGQQGTYGQDCPYICGGGKDMGKYLKGVKKIAYCGLGRITLKFYDYLKDICKSQNGGQDVELIEFSEELDAIKAVKSREELDAIANAAWIQDQLIKAAPAYVRPGRNQSELQADIMKLLWELNADMSVMTKLLISSGRNGEVDTFPTIAPKDRNHLCFPEYRLTEDDWVHIIYESPGIGGYYSETGRIFYFKEPCLQARQTWDETVKALEFQAGILKPGKTLHEIRKETNEYLKSRGSCEDTNIFQIRGIGNLTVDRPQLYDWDQMTLKPDMALSLQPRFRKDGCTAIALDTYVVTEGEAYRFSQVPQELVVL